MPFKRKIPGLPLACNERSQTASGSHLVCVAHYFTRNRTLGSDFPSFFLNASAVPTIVPRCFRMLFKQQQRMALPLGRV